MRSTPTQPRRSPPIAKEIGPCLHLEHPVADSVDHECSEPAILVVVVPHGRVGPGGGARPAIRNAREQQLVSFLENVGADLDALTDDTFDGEASAVQRWRDTLDRDPIDAPAR